MTKLAIVIPYYKINFFDKTLDSLALQTDMRFNVYIGDDASKDSPMQLIEYYKDKFQMHYIRFEDNLGGTSLVKQWERCLKFLKDEEWFMILGDDDVLGNNVVEEFYKNISEIEEKSNVVRFASKEITDDGSDRTPVYHHEKFENPITTYYKKFLGLNRGSLSEYIFNRKSFEKHLFRNYKLAWSTDDMAVIDVCGDKDIFSINGALVKVRFSDFNITGKSDNQELKMIAIANNLFDLLNEYQSRMNREEILFFIKKFDNKVLSLKDGNIKYYKLLIRLTFQYFPKKHTYILIKSIFAKYFMRK